jgi:hypothetical protein
MAGGHDTTPLREVRSSTQRLSHWHTPARRTSSTRRHRAKIRPSTSFGSRSIKRQNFRSLSFAFICSAPLQEQEQRERVVRGHCRNSSPENLHNCSITQRHRNLACVLCDHLHVLLESLSQKAPCRRSSETFGVAVCAFVLLSRRSSKRIVSSISRRRSTRPDSRHPKQQLSAFLSELYTAVHMQQPQKASGYFARGKEANASFASDLQRHFGAKVARSRMAVGGSVRVAGRLVVSGQKQMK